MASFTFDYYYLANNTINWIQLQTQWNVIDKGIDQE